MESKDEAEAGASVHRQSFNISNLWRNPASLVPITAYKSDAYILHRIIMKIPRELLH